ncbi:variant erythrocyte surface antigen-1 family protein [Babesia divergens]|uniref:Variant erythrocyte surface antigen-1 family protein n=1 Tax=Babesia divergens TaxID=32595 RepID=A0AAD9LGE4_BABDI|nr:variant erythrocyte surface antigen-1 family protein [Babesia divergens]
MDEICQCNDFEQCCPGGTCDGNSGVPGGSCDFCQNLNAGKSQPTTGLGLSPPNPIRLAKRLDKFFGDSSKPGCDCQCGSTGKSCCCLACPGNCSQACSCVSTGQCPCASKLQPPQCPRQKFCLAINSIKVSSGSSLMRCCNQGKDCHCKVNGSAPCSGQGCCENTKKSIKCLIRRLVTYFNSLGPNPSKPDFSQKCCDLLCVAKTCEFLRSFYNDTKYKSDSKPFHDELLKLKYSSPCGHDLWRTLDDFLYYCVHMVGAHVDRIKDKINAKGNTCSKCPTGKPGTSPCSCNNNCNGQCKGCDVLLKDSHLMDILTRKFSSSYDSSKAKWNLLCSRSQSQPCCSKPSCPCKSDPSVSTCDSKPCCPNCDVKKAAKIFLGMLPCMYWGLKILYERCQAPLTWPSWQSIDFDRNDLPSSGLAKFLYAWGYGLRPLISKKGTEFFSLLEKLFGSDSSGPLQKLSTLVTENYFTSNLISPPKDPKTPSTVRSMLLWLYGLRFQKHFSDLVENCKSLCLPFGKSFNADEFLYYIHTCCFILPLSIISFIETSESAQKAFSSSSSSEFFYPSDSSALTDMFFDYIRKIYIALDFLKFQCERGRDQAGWKDCFFGGKCKDVLGISLSSFSLPTPTTPVPSASSPAGCISCCPGQGFICTNIPGLTDHGEHCKKEQCIGSTPCPPTNGNNAHTSGTCKPCPHPLQRFLTHGSESKSPSEAYPFGLSGIVPMGFSKENLSSTARDGWSLYHVLKAFCESGFYPLTRLVQFALCIFRNPPDTLGELFGFFKKFVEALNSKSDLSSKFIDWINGEPGSYPGKALQDAVRGLYGSGDSHKNSSHPYDLRSLIACDGPKGSSNPTCGQYLCSFTEYAYKDFIEDFLDTYLSWVCYSAEKFKEKLKGFYNEASEKFSCCLESSSKCPKIVECTCALPFLYSYGFTFWSPNTLNCHGSGGHKGKPEQCTRKTCSDFIAQLRFVIWGKPFKALLEEIPKLIWSIRKPFFLFVLAFWAFVISYFLYVQLYKLDLLHIDSHLHLSRSFKILPSTLFSDASSKLKDLSYFTL